MTVVADHTHRRRRGWAEELAVVGNTDRRSSDDGPVLLERWSMLLDSLAVLTAPRNEQPFLRGTRGNDCSESTIRVHD